MKKLLKQEWKLYVGIFLITLYVLVQMRMHFDFEYYELSRDNKFECYEMTKDYLVPWVDAQMNELHQVVFFSMPQIIILFLLIRKALVFWIERSSYGREFLQTLPVTRMQRLNFHLCMDVLYVLLSTIAGFIINYITLNQYILEMGFEVPWLLSSVIGEAVLVCSYLLFILAFMNFWEMFFVDGFVRSIAVAGVFVGIFDLVVMSGHLDAHPRYIPHKMLTKFFSVGYLTTLDAPGILNPEFFYQGNIVECPYSVRMQGYDIKMSSLFQMYNFSEADTYIAYAAGYVVIAVVLIAFAVWCYKRQELSRKGFYFSFGRYLFNGWICMMFMIISLYFSVAFVGKFVIMAAGVLLFLGLNHAMNPDRKKLRFGKQISKR